MTYPAPQKKFYLLMTSHSHEVLICDFGGNWKKIFRQIPGIFSKMKYLLKYFSLFVENLIMRKLDKMKKSWSLLGVQTEDFWSCGRMR